MEVGDYVPASVAQMTVKSDTANPSADSSPTMGAAPSNAKPAELAASDNTLAQSTMTSTYDD